MRPEARDQDLRLADVKAMLPEIALLTAIGAGLGGSALIVGAGGPRMAAALTVGTPMLWGVMWLLAGAGSPARLPIVGPTLDVIDRSTERFDIRRLSASDVAAYAASLDEVMLRTHGWSTEFRDALITEAGHGGARLAEAQLIITERGTGQAVAFASIAHADPPGTWSAGFWVMPERRGEGLGVEAFAGALEVFHDMGIAVVRIGTAVDNFGMQAISRHLGATFVETRPHELADGSLVESHWYTHTRPSSEPTR